MLLYNDHNLTLTLRQNGETHLVKNFGNSRVLARMDFLERRAEVIKYCTYKFHQTVLFA
ncbi:hypothetical protein [Vibrio sp. 10N.239.312.D08]|uniref:hypothetical protein n=1 Tax=Vibrio sp. 10N.239.312.D08 TaxID=3229978 RepID=UPI0035506CD9